MAKTKGWLYSQLTIYVLIWTYALDYCSDTRLNMISCAGFWRLGNPKIKVFHAIQQR